MDTRETTVVLKESVTVKFLGYTLFLAWSASWIAFVQVSKDGKYIRYQEDGSLVKFRPGDWCAESAYDPHGYWLPTFPDKCETFWHDLKPLPFKVGVERHPTDGNQVIVKLEGTKPE